MKHRNANSLPSLLEDDDNARIVEGEVVLLWKNGTAWAKVNNSRSGGSGRSWSLHNSCTKILTCSRIYERKQTLKFELNTWER